MAIRMELGLIFLQSLLFWVDFEELFVLFKKKKIPKEANSFVLKKTAKQLKVMNTHSFLGFKNDMFDP